MFPKAKTFRPRSRQGVLMFAASAILLASTVNLSSQSPRGLQNPTSGDPVSKILLLQIIRAEDQRRWDDDLRGLFSARNANVRERAALAAGRIGDEAAVPELVRLLRHDDDIFVRAMAAFALGEIESPLGAEALVAVLRDGDQVGARAVEALGKITAALPKEQEARSRELAATVLGALNFQANRRSMPDEMTTLLALTAVLRAKPENAGPVVTQFLHNPDPRIRADVANTLARLKLKDGNEQLRKLLTSDPDPVVRANAARVLGATEDKAAFDSLLERMLNDPDSRVRVSAIRALASLKDRRAAEPLLKHASDLLGPFRKARAAKLQRPLGQNELLEVVTALSRVMPQATEITTDSYSRFLRAFIVNLRGTIYPAAPEVELAEARLYPHSYVAEFGSGQAGFVKVQTALLTDWRRGSSLAQGLGEIAALPDITKDKAQLSQRAEALLRSMLDYRNSGLNINTFVAVHSEYAVPDVLRAFAAFKPKDLGSVLRKHLQEADVVVRGIAADLLGELPPDETNARALIDALPVALADKQLNDAALSILDALGKQKSTKANEAIKTALDSRDYLIRRKAVAVLKEAGAGDFSSRIGAVQTRNTTADYERAMARMGQQVTAVVTTTKGSFTIKLLPEQATLTVDNFIQLARSKYFNSISVHRVVPNFVMQDGDPRGDGNGGPGYQIRCEINEMPYDRAAVGMALSGKDTGGSQWFVTHSPQPHLDGGYTVFGDVASGMEVVDNIARGDVIRSIVIKESAGRRGANLRPQER